MFPRQRNASTRRRTLLKWIAERDQHDGLTASQIADVSGVYDYIQHGRGDRCFDDLMALARDGLVARKGRPAVWSLVVWEKASR